MVSQPTQTGAGLRESACTAAAQYSMAEELGFLSQEIDGLQASLAQRCGLPAQGVQEALVRFRMAAGETASGMFHDENSARFRDLASHAKHLTGENFKDDEWDNIALTLAECEDLKTRGLGVFHELYALRTHASAVPTLKSNDHEEKLMYYQEVYDILRPEVELIADLAELQEDIASLFKQVFERVASKRELEVRLFMPPLLHLLDLTILLDCLKDSKPCLQNDFAAYKRAFHMVKGKMPSSQVNELTTEQETIQFFLADPKCPKSTFFNHLMEGIHPVRHSVQTLGEILAWTAKRLRTRDYFTPESKWQLERTLPFIVLALDLSKDEKGNDINIFKSKKVMTSDVMKTIKAHPVLRIQADMHLTTESILLRCPHFGPNLRDAYYTDPRDPKFQVENSLANLWPYFKLQYEVFQTDFQALLFRLDTAQRSALTAAGDSTGIDIDLAHQAHACVLRGLSLLSEWREAILYEAACKFVCPADDKALSKHRIPPSDPGAAYAKGGVANYSSTDIAVLSDTIALLKSLGASLQTQEHTLAPFIRASIYDRLQGILDETPESFSAALSIKKRKALKDLISSLRLVIGDPRRASASGLNGSANDGKKSDKKKKSGGVFTSSRKLMASSSSSSSASDTTSGNLGRVHIVIPSATQLHVAYNILRTIIPEAEDSRAAKASGLFNQTSSSSLVDSNSTQGSLSSTSLSAASSSLPVSNNANAAFYESIRGPTVGRARLPVPLHLLLDTLRTATAACDLGGSIHQLTNLGELYFHEFYLDLAREPQFSKSLSLTYALAKSTLSSPASVEMNATLHVLDIYNDAAHMAIKAYKQQHLFDEVEGEANCALDYAIKTLSRMIYMHQKTLQAAAHMDARFRAKLERAKHSGSTMQPTPFRNFPLINETNLRMVGRHVDLAGCIAEQVEMILLHDVEAALETFENNSFCGIMQLESHLSVIQLTRDALDDMLPTSSILGMRDLLVESNACGVGRDISKGRILAHVINMIPQILLDFTYNHTTDRFTLSEDQLTLREQDFVPAGPFASHLLYGSSATQWFEVVHKRERGYLGIEHFLSMIRVLGQAQLGIVIEGLLQGLARHFYDRVEPHVQNAARAMTSFEAPSVTVPLRTRITNFERYTNAVFNNEESKGMAMQAFRVFGNGISIMRLIQGALDEVEIAEFTQLAPFFGFYSTKQLDFITECNDETKERHLNARTPVFASFLERLGAVFAQSGTTGFCEISSVIQALLVRPNERWLAIYGDGIALATFLLIHFATDFHTFSIRGFCEQVLQAHFLQGDVQGDDQEAIRTIIARAKLLHEQGQSTLAAFDCAFPRAQYVRMQIYHPPTLATLKIEKEPEYTPTSTSPQESKISQEPKSPEAVIRKPMHIRRSVYYKS